MKHLIEKLPRFSKRKFAAFVGILLFFLFFLGLTYAFIMYKAGVENQLAVRDQEILSIQKNLAVFSSQLAEKETEIMTIKSIDEKQRNDSLEASIGAIEKEYAQGLKHYEELMDLIEEKGKTSPVFSPFGTFLSLLSKGNYVEATAIRATLASAIASEKAKRATVSANLLNVKVSNTPPVSGYSKQKVQTTHGEFIVDIVSGDLNSTRVVVDTASDGNCSDNCPVLPLATYIVRSGAYAGINGTYFCPESYPSCAGKKNSFDLLVMNKSKTYFNSDNNVYSTNPAAIFSAGGARFVAKTQEWGRDTGVDSVISNFPLLLINGTITVSGVSDGKMTGRGSRSFIGAKGSTAYIGVIRNANVEEMALVLKTLGLDHAINLDSGGSTALWSGGYKVGPGRSIPNAVLFVRR